MGKEICAKEHNSPGGQPIDAVSSTALKEVAITNANTQSAATGGTHVVTLLAEAVCYIATGANPNAQSGATGRLPANVPVRWWINPGDKIATFGAAAAGKLYIMEAGPPPT